MYTCKSRYLTRGEVWYDDEPTDTHAVDWIVYYQRSHPLVGTKWEEFYTYVIDLFDPVETLQAQLNQDTAYKIRRARERDKIVCEECDSRDSVAMDEFEAMYRQFAASKGLGPLDRARVESIAAAGALDVSIAKDRFGNPLVYHANYRNHSRATQLYLPSAYRNVTDKETRNLIGRANRYLTWSDILRYKAQGLRYFDFGGWYTGNDPEMARINDFKRGFGGQVRREYQCEQILTLKGWTVLNAGKLLKRARHCVFVPGKSSESSQPPNVQTPVAIGST